MERWKATDLLCDSERLRFGVPNDHVDILNSIGEMQFDEAWTDRVDGEIDGVTVPCISKASLLKNKRQTGRPRDLVDVEELELRPDTWEADSRARMAATP